MQPLAWGSPSHASSGTITGGGIISLGIQSRIRLIDGVRRG